MATEQTIGPWRLIEPIGRGGMGIVWRAFHRDGGEPVAIKLVAPALVSADAVGLFRRELHTVAALDHQAVVRVLDVGEIPDDVAQRSLGLLAAGSPYLVMELVDGGTLDDHRDGLTWPVAREVLRQILDALAHAHARQIIHRDLKPSNVLVRAFGPGPSVALGDFGIACMMEEIDKQTSSHAAGTPAYMAPEQLEAAWREFGPWTDLYAVGCLAWELCAGAPPLSDGSMASMVIRRVRGELPPFEPTMALPPGVEAWLHGLLAHDPYARVACAADASAELLALPAAEQLATGVARPRDPASTHELAVAPTLPRSEVLTPDDTHIAGDAVATDDTVVTSPGVDAAQAAQTGRRPAHSPATSAAAPAQPVTACHGLPASWRASESGRGDGRVVSGEGSLALFGVRTVPVCGREDERDELWRAARVVVEHGELRVVVLEGPSGVGKTRLAAWLTRRLAELGAARVLRVDHDPMGGGGLAGMLEREFRCGGLSLDARRERIARLAPGLRGHSDWLDAELGLSLADDLDMLAALSADRVAAGGGVPVANPVERHVVLERWLRQLAAHRPVVLWLEDVQWGAESLALVQHLVRVSSFPLLVVTTHDPESLEPGAGVAAQLAAIAGDERAERVTLEPLDADAGRAMVARTLALAPSSVDAVAAVSQGMPRIALQLLTTLACSGALVTRDRAELAIDAPALARLPATRQVLWEVALAVALGALPEQSRVDARRALELGAVLGRNVETGRWRAACVEAGVEPPDGLIEALARHRLVALREQGWSFDDGALHALVLEGARERGALPSYHAACAAVLEAEGVHSAQALGRLAEHLIGCGRVCAARTQLEAAARLALDSGDLALAERMVDRCMAWLQTASSPPGAAALARTWLLRLRIDEASGRAERLDVSRRECAQAIAAVADPAEVRWLTAQHLELEARRAYHDGQLERARDHLLAALDACQDLSRAQALRPELYNRLGDVIFMMGHIDAAAERYAQALEAAECVGAREVVGVITINLAQTASLRGDHEAAEALASRALVALADAGARLKLAQALSERGEIARRRGNLERSRAYYQACCDMCVMLGAELLSPHFNLALVEWQLGRVAGARAHFEALARRALASGERSLVAGCEVLLMACAAAERDWAAMDAHLGRAVVELERTGLVYDDIALGAERAATLAELAGQPELAARAWHIAHDQRTRLGRTP